MSNFASSLASLRGATRIGGTHGTSLLNIDAYKDLFRINKLVASLGEIKGEMGKEYIEAEEARGKGSLLGGIIGGGLGFLLSGGQPWAAAAGAGAGTGIGGRVGQRKDVSDLMAQKRAAEAALGSFKDVFFHSSKATEAKTYGKDVANFVDYAKTRLKQLERKDILANALTALSATKALLKFDPKGTGKAIGEHITGKDYVGSDVIGGIKEYLKSAEPSEVTSMAVDPILSKKYTGSQALFDLAGRGGTGTEVPGLIPIGPTLSDMLNYEAGKHILPEPFSITQIGYGGPSDWLGKPSLPLFQTGIIK